MRETAKRFGVSDVALAKACRRANIPTPERGYWAKKEAGKRVVRPLLPARALGASDELTIGGSTYYRGYGPDEDIDGPEPPAPVFEEALDLIRERVLKTVGKVAAPPLTGRVHVEIRKLLENDDLRRQKQLARGYFSSWDAPRFDDVVGKRKLRILNALFFALSKAGAKPSVGRGNEPSLDVQVGTQHFGLKLELVERRTAASASRGSREPSDSLRLDLVRGGYDGTAMSSWADAPAAKLEVRLQEIAIDIAVAGEVKYREQVIASHEWRLKWRASQREERKRKAAEAARRERERLAELEAAKLDGLLADARSYREAEDIRAYIATVLQRDLPAEDREEVRSWADWALDIADRRDPVKAGRYLRRELR